ncbi:MAG: hypothetical protein WD876_01575 [Candidatus Pacearchaeota archaeon]
MVKKEMIGKIQLWVGAGLLLISLAGIIIGFSSYIGNSSDIVDLFGLNFGGYSNPLDAVTIILLKLNILISSVLLLIISVLFITQGILNNSEDK